MAEYGQSPYGDAGQAVSQAGQAAHQIAVASARQKFQQQYMQQQMMLRMQQLRQQDALARQHGALYGAQTDLANANAAKATQEAVDLSNKEAAANSFSQAMGGVARYGQAPLGRVEGPFEQTARGANYSQQMINAVQQAAALAGRGNQHAFPSLAQGAQVQDPRFQLLLGLGKGPTQNLSSGGYSQSFFPEILPSQAAPFTLGAGQQRFAPPVTPGSTMMPGMGLNEGPQQPIATAPFNPSADDPAGRQYGRDAQLLGHLTDKATGEVDFNNPLAAQVYTNLLKQAQGQQMLRGQMSMPSSGIPQTGEVRKGYRFKGGNPSDKTNWEPVH